MDTHIIVVTGGDTIAFLRKDKNVVDILDEGCIMPYVVAAELASKMSASVNAKVTPLKEIVLKININTIKEALK